MYYRKLKKEPQMVRYLENPRESSNKKKLALDFFRLIYFT